MTEDKIFEGKIELVFKFHKSLTLNNILKDQNNNLIIEQDFWNRIFEVWINIVLSENIFTNLSNFKLEQHNFSLSFEIINDELIANLNEKWLHKKGPTDVLSFPIISNNDIVTGIPVIELGDLFISLETAEKQSKKFKNSLMEEMIWLASHGFLHLLGWDHRNENELKEMLDFQQYLISKLN